MELRAGAVFPDLDLPDRPRRLSEVAGGDPLVLVTSRGWWCPKEQRFLRGLVALQDELEVAYTRLVVVSVDAPEVQAAFRAGLPLLGDELVCLTTLALDASLCAGAITVARTPRAFADDPFVRLFPGTTVRTDLFSCVPPPPGPAIERYSGLAWPGGQFRNR